MRARLGPYFLPTKMPAAKNKIQLAAIVSGLFTKATSLASESSASSRNISKLF